MVNESSISGLINNSYLDKKITVLATKAELKAKQDKLLRPQEFDLSYFHGKSHFKDDGTQIFSVSVNL